MPIRFPLYLISPPFHALFLMVLILLVYFRQMIQSTIKNTEKGALLTTQNLVEAETLCDRIAIMVSGRLRWVSFHSLHLTCPPQNEIPYEKETITRWSSFQLPQ